MEQDKSLGRLLRLSSFLMKKNIDNILTKTESEVTVAKGYILLFLHCRQAQNIDTYQKDIEQEFRISKATVSDSLSYLEEIGYIKRVNSKEDKRLKKIVLTEVGLSFYEHFAETRKRVSDIALNNFSDEEKNQAYDMLERICNNLCEGSKE